MTTTKLKTLLSLFAFAASAIILSNCADDESGGKKLTYTIDGTDQEVDYMSAFLQFEIQHDHEGRAMLIAVATGESKMLSVAVSNWDFQNPPDEGILEGEYDATFDFQLGEENPVADCLELTGANAGVFLCEGAMLSYLDDTDFYYSFFGDSPEATITITECNTSEHTITGSFTGKVQNDMEEELLITGEFTSLKYIVQ